MNELRRNISLSEHLPISQLLVCTGASGFLPAGKATLGNSKALFRTFSNREAVPVGLFPRSSAPVVLGQACVGPQGGVDRSIESPCLSPCHGRGHSELSFVNDSFCLRCVRLTAPSRQRCPLGSDRPEFESEPDISQKCGLGQGTRPLWTSVSLCRKGRRLPLPTG